MTGTTEGKQKLDIDWVRTLAAALAAVSSAVILSTLGSVGTIVGAAVGSVVASLGTSLYTQGLSHSKERVAQAQDVARGRIRRAEVELRRARGSGTETPTGRVRLEHAQQEMAAARHDLGEAQERNLATAEDDGPTWRDRLAVLPWKRIALFAAGVFLIVLVAITAFEMLSGRSVASYTGDDDRRSTILGGTDRDDDGDRAPSRDESTRPNPSQDPSEDRTPNDPATDPTEDGTEPTDEPTDPTTGPTDPTDQPSEEPTPPPAAEPAPPTEWGPQE